MIEAITNFLGNLFRADSLLWLFYPLCAVVAVVYKATKFDTPKKILLAALHFFISVSLGMFALALLFYLVSKTF